MINFLRISVTVLILFLLIAKATSQEAGVKPDAGFVPDEITATRVAEAILIPIYGKKEVESERPFSAKLLKGVWKVEGHLPPDVDGGVAEVWIDKQDGKILRVTHGK
jgi:NTF2 fold immunity protein